ncbi:MAG: Ig-like domain-containing protein [Bacteroidales bacterium]|nr:Ig-like domain-containing protein [Bacteroidales bacterium]
MKKILTYTMTMAMVLVFVSCKKEKDNDILVIDVKLNRTTAFLVLGDTLHLSATIEPENATKKDVTWSVTGTAATVENGMVTAVEVGEAIVTVTTVDGNKIANCTITVTAEPVPVTGVTLTPSSITLTKGTSSLPLNATVLPSNATNQTLLWSSKDTTIATVLNGVVTAITEGTTFIIVTTQDGNKTDSCEVIVTTDYVASNPRLLVLNEGLRGMNNSSITSYDLVTGQVTQDVFFKQNGRILGDIANDILIYGGKIYISVGFSSTIEVTDLELNSIQQISLKDGSRNREPHGLAAHDGKVYIACFDGYVARLDTVSIEIDGFVKVGYNPENIAISKGFAYVTNSGGMNYLIGLDYDSTVSVIDLVTFTEVKKIVVEKNPFSIGVDANGDIIVGCRGDYIIPYSLHRINTTTNTYDKKFAGITPTDFVMKGNIAYYYNYNWSTFTGEYVEYNTATETIVRPSFINNPSLIETPYAININHENEDIYLSNAEYMGNGKVFAFDKNGAKRFEFTAGIWPKKIVILK